MNILQRIKDGSTPYLLILPSVIFLFFVFLIPFFEIVVLPFRDVGGGFSIENFLVAADDLNFDRAVRNTIFLVIAVVSAQLVFALGAAMLLTRLKRGRDIYLYIWTIPLGISDLAGGLVWLALLTERGFMNSFLYQLGIIEGPILWLSYESPVVLFIAVLLAEFWRASAVMMIIIVAGAQLIPKEYTEAAEVLGASAWQRFIRITLPLLKPSIQTALILRTILAFEVFAVVVALTGFDFRVLVQEAYLWQFEYRESGVAAVYAIIVFGLSALTTIFFLVCIRVRREAMT